MASTLSSYWVEFFKKAGFPQDVATKHAVIFSNNRIKPDMLPDLDKPSLKEMGITLMGDMIAILRYAKKVVEETTCENFLVSSEDSCPVTKNSGKTTLKKVVTKVAAKTIPLTKVKSSTLPLKSASTTASSTIVKKKTLPVEIKKPVKRRIEKEIKVASSDSEDEWKAENQKKSRVSNDNVDYKVIMTEGVNPRSQQSARKKAVDQKLTVFDRLGDSSVTSTTNSTESSTTFNITGLGKDVIKRNSSVFNRLGDKDSKREDINVSNNGSSNINLQETSKIQPSNKIGAVKSNGISKGIMKRPVGTMRADRELISSKTSSTNVRQLINNTKEMDFIDKITSGITKKFSATTTKLASEQVTTIPAKLRLGTAGSVTKQVRFSKVASVAQIKKPGVFSRLGI